MGFYSESLVIIIIGCWLMSIHCVGKSRLHCVNSSPWFSVGCFTCVNFMPHWFLRYTKIAIKFSHRHLRYLVCRELETFYKQNKDKANVHAVYLLSGEMNDEHCDGDQRCNKPPRCRRVQLVREKNLEAIKHKYRTVDTCEIFCLHSKPIKVIFSFG